MRRKRRGHFRRKVTRSSFPSSRSSLMPRGEMATVAADAGFIRSRRKGVAVSILFLTIQTKGRSRHFVCKKSRRVVTPQKLLRVQIFFLSALRRFISPFRHSFLVLSFRVERTLFHLPFFDLLSLRLSVLRALFFAYLLT